MKAPRLMRIALFTDTYLPNTDGVVSSILAYRQGLRTAGHEMLVFAPDSPKAVPEENVHRYSGVAFPPYPDYRLPIFPDIPADFLKRKKVQIIHSKAMAAMGLAARSLSRKANVPSLASLETMIPEGTHYVIPIKNSLVEGLGRKIGWSYLRWFYSGFDLVTSPSRHAQGVMAENGIGSLVLPSPIDTGRFRPNRNGDAVKRSLGIGGKRVIASVGRVVEEKNYGFLLSAAKEMRGDDAVFMIVGKGPYLEALKRKALADGLGGKFIFTGFVPDGRLVDYYNAADCFVFPSRFETQGLAALEALSCGKAACVMDGTPMAEVVNAKNGQVFADDAKDCAEKLSKCLAEGERMAPHCRKSALPYSIPSCTKSLVSIYRRLLE